MKESLRLIAFAMIWVVLGFVIAICLTKCGSPTPTLPIRGGSETVETKRDTVYLTDTIIDVKPVPVNIASTGIETRKLPVSINDTIYKYLPRDSIEVDIPISQVEYSDSNYQAWVSGFEPRLDSIRIFKQTEVITIENLIKEKPKRWHIGPTIGYGYTPKGFEPFIGVSLTYSLFSF